MSNILGFSVDLLSIMVGVGILIVSIAVGVYCGLAFYYKDNPSKKRK